jgi:hypothetical protein
VHDRAPATSFGPAELHGYHTNDPELVAAKLLDPLLAGRNRFALDRPGAWQLHTPLSALDHAWPVHVQVNFVDPVPVRPERLIARGLGLSGNETLRRIKSDIPLHRPTNAGFALDLRRARRFSGGRLRWGRRC